MHLADALLNRNQAFARVLAIRRRQQRVLDRDGADAGRFELFHGALDVERIAVAVVGIAHQRQIGGPADSPHLLGELRQGDQHDIGRAQHHHGGHRAREHAAFEAEVFGHPRRERIEDVGRMNAALASEKGAKALAFFGRCHGVVLI